MIDPSNPFTQFEWDELGNPNEEEYCNYILSYSPYNNVERKQYPHILITAGLMDTRVSFAGPGKIIENKKFFSKKKFFFKSQNDCKIKKNEIR